VACGEHSWVTLTYRYASMPIRPLRLRLLGSTDRDRSQPTLPPGEAGILAYWRLDASIRRRLSSCRWFVSHSTDRYTTNTSSCLPRGWHTGIPKRTGISVSTCRYVNTPTSPSGGQGSAWLGTDTSSITPILEQTHRTVDVHWVPLRGVITICITITPVRQYASTSVLGARQAV
jgi:hypothetical protein